MEKNYIYFATMIKAKNIISVFEDDSAYKRKGTISEAAVFEYLHENDGDANFNITFNSKKKADFERCFVYIFDKDYAFIASRYRYDFSQTSASGLEDAIAFRSSGSAEFEFPDMYVFSTIFCKYNESDKIEIFYPQNGSTMRREFKACEDSWKEMDALYHNDDDPKESYFLYTFDTNLCMDSDLLQNLKTIAEVGFIDEDIQPELPLLRLNDSLSALCGNEGVGIIKKGPEDIYPDQILLKYLKALKEYITTEIKTKENNRILDNGFEEIKDLESIKAENLKGLRNIVHMKNAIKNAPKEHTIQSNFYNVYMENGPFGQLLDDYEESCNSMKDGIEIELEKREKKRSAVFDKTFSVIGILALISAFKDGSDLNISFLEVLHDGALKDAITFTSFISPVLCFTLVLVILIFLFRRK